MQLQEMTQKLLKTAHWLLSTKQQTEQLANKQSEAFFAFIIFWMQSYCFLDISFKCVSSAFVKHFKLRMSGAI